MSSTRSRYPNIALQSKNELAKRLSDRSHSFDERMAFIDDVKDNFDTYWHDTTASEAEEGKFVRSAKGKPLGELLYLLDKKLLSPHDVRLPPFIFGGVSGKSHLVAAQYLLGYKRQRTLLALDIRRFYDQVGLARVETFFHTKAGCGERLAHLLAHFCCVPVGAKGSLSDNKVLARGFATSARLAVWCNLDVFLRMNWLVQRRLKGYDPRVAMFVDDIGITASRVPYELMEHLRDEIIALFATFDLNQPLPIHMEKTKILTYSEGIEHLGVKLNRKSLSFGRKTIKKRAGIIKALKVSPKGHHKKKPHDQLRSYGAYGRQIGKINSDTTT
ncbi:MAG: reverse transcriptase domain-containing protein [bacterium]|nr:reverse transcriptase domain-containing protein [bacterium]